MERKNRKPLAVAIVTVAAAKAALGAIYIAPADIDTYKQKTDQSFYDLYQNPESVVKSNPNMQGYTAAIETGQRLFEGQTIQSIAQASIMGSPIKGGTTARINLAGRPYTIAVDDSGKVYMNGYKANKSQVRLNGVDAKPVSSVTCVANGKYGCSQQSRTAQEIYFDASSGILTQANVNQLRNQSCGKYGCSPTSSWTTSNLLRMDRSPVDIHSILKNNERVTTITLGNHRTMNDHYRR